MIQKNLAKKSLPPEVEKTMIQVGERIRIARKKRSLTMQGMAERMFVTRKTLARLEKGDPGVSLAVFVSALWVLGLEEEFKGLILPENDKIGLYHERKRLPERVRTSRIPDDLDF